MNQHLASSQSISQKPDTSFPIFVYGSLKPGELAYPLISSLVAATRPATLSDYVLQIADGVAYARKQEGYQVSGFELRFTEPEQAYEAISHFEGTESTRPRYLWSTAILDSQRVNVLVSRGRINNATFAEDWSIQVDDVFSKGFPWVRKKLSESIEALNLNKISDPKRDEYWDSYFQLQSTLLYLWSIQERLELFRLGATSQDISLGQRRREFQADPQLQEAIKAANIDHSLSAHSYRNPSGLGTSAENSPLMTWFEIRSNITHHAKGSEREVDKVITASVDHFNTLLNYFELCSPKLALLFADLTPLRKGL